MREGGIDRLLSAVAEAGGCIPARLVRADAPSGASVRDRARAAAAVTEARADLDRDLDAAFALDRSFNDLSGPATAKARLSALASIIVRADRLVALLGDAEREAKGTAPSFPLPPPSGRDDHLTVSSVAAVVRRLQAGAKTEAERIEAGGFAEKAPTQYLTGAPRTRQSALLESLAKTFQRHFEMEPKFQYLDRLPVGPWAAFLAVVLADAGQPLEPAALAKAWERSAPEPADKGSKSRG